MRSMDAGKRPRPTTKNVQRAVQGGTKPPPPQKTDDRPERHP